MRSWGARASSCALVVLAALLCGALTSCSEELDQAQGVQTRIGRIAEVVASDVTSIDADNAGTVRIDYREGLAAPDVVLLAGEVAAAAATQGYRGYRLTLREAGDPDHVLVVVDTFADQQAASEVVEHWQRLCSALIGDVRYDAEPGSARVEVESGGGFVHDVTEAARIGVQTLRTTWHFTAEGTDYVDEGALRPQDVLLAERVQRTVASPSLPVGASAWRLQTSNDHVLLDLRPGLAPMANAELTVGRYGEEVRSLVDAAVDALDVTARPLWLRLRHGGSDPSSPADDVFGWWTSDREPVRGGDALFRGWDTWLQEVAGTSLAGDPS